GEMPADGTSIALWSDVRRLRYRESVRQEKLVQQGEIVRCDLNPGLFIARRMAIGSRLRLVVSAPNSIYFEKNYNSDGMVANQTAKDARTAQHPRQPNQFVEEFRRATDKTLIEQFSIVAEDFADRAKIDVIENGNQPQLAHDRQQRFNHTRTAELPGGDAANPDRFMNVFL